MNAVPADRSAGLTLIEVLIATVIIAIIAIGVMSSLSTAFVADRNTQDAISARNFAQETMESTTATSFDQLLSLNGSSVNRDDMTATISVNQVASGLMRIQVDVTNDKDAEVNVRLVTLSADRS